MISCENPDPLIGEELIRIGLERHGVELRFEKTVLQIWNSFGLRAKDQTVVHIDPSNQDGNLSHLWRLIGRKVESVSIDEAIALAFDGGSRLEIPPNPGHARGAWLGGDDKTYIFEEF
jgi:hypothetical protein